MRDRVVAELYDKLLIFDLDGTLWKENSHVSIVEEYLGWKKYTNLLARIWCKLSFKSYMKSLNNDYYDMPYSYVQNFKPHINENIVKLYEKSIKDGYEAIIISNAPNEIIDFASKYFEIRAFGAEIGNKSRTLGKSGIKYNYMVVVTDNLSDMDLIKMSHKTYFIISKNKKRAVKQIKPYLDKIILVHME